MLHKMVSITVNYTGLYSNSAAKHELLVALPSGLVIDTNKTRCVTSRNF